jgi:hypothetical protein
MPRPLPTLEEYIASNNYFRAKIREKYKKRGLEPPVIPRTSPSPLKGRSRPNLQKPRKLLPHKWKTGPDPLTHEQFGAWHQHRAQARHRREQYDLTFEQYQQVWGDLFVKRGRARYEYCLTRLDPKLPWNLENTQAMTRQEHLERNLNADKNNKKVA